MHDRKYFPSSCRLINGETPAQMPLVEGCNPSQLTKKISRKTVIKNHSQQLHFFSVVPIYDRAKLKERHKR